MHELIANYGLAALAVIASGLGLLMSKYVLVAIESKKVRDYVSRAYEEAKAAFLEVGETYVKALKDANEDGKLTEGEKAEAKKRAIAIAKSNLGKKGLQRLARIFDVDSWLANKIEAFVGESKDPKPAA